MESFKCYSFGYQGQSPQKLVEKLEQLDAVLLDIRFQPLSRNPVWRKASLQKRLGNRYQHIVELGNLLYKGGSICILDMKVGVKLVLQNLEQKPVVLMCVCSNPLTCHRNVVAEALAKCGVEVEELSFEEETLKLF